MGPTLWVTVWSDYGEGNSLKVELLCTMRTVEVDCPWCGQNWWKVCSKQFCRTGASQFRKSHNCTNCRVGRRQYKCSHFLLLLCNNYCCHETALFPHSLSFSTATHAHSDPTSHTTSDAILTYFLDGPGSTPDSTSWERSVKWYLGK